MTVLNVFDGDAFGVQSLTTAINKIPHAPSYLGAQGIFRQSSMATTSAVIEEQHGRLSLIPNVARGTRNTTDRKAPRVARSFKAPHLPVIDRVMADDVQNVRTFGSEDNTDAVSDVVSQKLSSIAQDLETTKEFHRVGAVSGIVLDADNSTVIHNFFTDFSITEQTQEFDFTASTPTLKNSATAVSRAIQTALGGTIFTGVQAICSDTFFDALVDNAEVKDSYDRWNEQLWQRSLQANVPNAMDQGIGFMWGGIFWHNYRGAVGAVPFIPAGVARFYPIGTDIFQEINAPADYVETVGTMGLPMYAKQERLPMDKGIEIEGQANPLLICNRPRALVKGSFV